MRSRRWGRREAALVETFDLLSDAGVLDTVVHRLIGGGAYPAYEPEGWPCGAVFWTAPEVQEGQQAQAVLVVLEVQGGL